MSRRVNIVIFVALTIVLTFFGGILGNAVILPSFIKDNQGFIWLLVVIILFALICLGVMQQLMQQSETPSIHAKQPGQERFLRLSLNASLNGIISLGVILLIIGIAFLRGWNIAWWYFVSTILSYILFLVLLARLESLFLTKSLFSSSEDKRNTTVTIGPFRISRANKVQLWMSAHLALILLVVGLWLHPSNFVVQVGIFVGAVIAGGGIPFIGPFIVRHLSNLTSITPPVVWSLVVVDSGPSLLARGTQFNLTPRTTIGSGPANTIQIQDPTISTEHTRILFRKGIWYVQDAGTANGTFVNMLSAHDALEAHFGDIISIGSIQFKLLYSAPAQSTVNAGQAQPAAASVQPSVGVMPGWSDPQNSPASVGLQRARLTIRLPQGKQQMYPIEKPVVDIGRNLTNDIILKEKCVSRCHAQIMYQPDGQFALFDLGSTDGITINGTPYQRSHILRNGDVFTIGSYNFYFERR